MKKHLYISLLAMSIFSPMVGPALTSGRVVDIAVNPKNPDNWFIAAACGGVWTTTNHGTTFSPIFDNYGSFSIACVELAPSNPNTVWVGTGENNNQRSVSYGRGVYKSIDGGKTWERTLFVSDETGISEIAIDPTNPDILYAAAHQRRRHEWTYIGGGPESAMYKSTDGGKTWRKINVGLPEGQMGRIGIAVSPVDANYVYAIVEGREDK